MLGISEIYAMFTDVEFVLRLIPLKIHGAPCIDICTYNLLLFFVFIIPEMKVKAFVLPVAGMESQCRLLELHHESLY